MSIRKGYKGQYNALIMINGVRKYIGTFRTEKQAREAYQEIRAKHPKQTGFKK